MSIIDSPCDDFYSNQRLSNRKRLKTKTYENDFLNNEEQLMLNQVDENYVQTRSELIAVKSFTLFYQFLM